ncbi:unnamed protein product [Rotaria sordida]|uniref:GH18 domain-containing protein n=1 Tax=Rotaria sordida TaxID=392033 RepID=A0A815FH43_9BILA|nr:unnamed protein product [Rotaria sordida]CAF1354975.1 unnamed protein product [Rotaria sordida]CAF3593595.1 unnamed protein product [Rotaria sordida]CAF4014280.1 unnamed protein product [Rotaria sordida]
MVTGPIILAYFTAWSIYQRSYFVSDIPGDKITHINYAFANIGSDGRITLGDSWADIEKTFAGDTWDQPLRGNFNQLIKLKEKYPHLRTLISVGGWTWSGKFSDVALTDQSRSTFAASCVEFIKKYGFDGVDLDWEYPVSGGLPSNSRRPEDKQNYVLLLKELRRQLDAVPNKKYLLTVATGAGTERIADMNLPGMAAYLDWFNVMTYDFHGGWETKTGHNAPLYKNNDETTSDTAPSFIKSKYNCDAAIQAYITAGVSSTKILMGLALYGRGWQGVTNTALNGFSQTASSQLPTGTWENGIYDYDHLKKSFISSNKRYWDDQSKVPFLFNPSTGLWISYDDVESINLKNNYIKQNKLGGAFFWELSSDRQTELIGATFNVLNNGVKPPVVTSSSSTKPSITIKVTTTTTTQSTNPGNASEWKPHHSYLVNDQVKYQGKTYRCRQAHTSLPDWIPSVVPALWLMV